MSTDLETLCKLYLELANVVPKGCKTAHELELQYQCDKYGLALTMIREGVADPMSLARDTLLKFSRRS